MPKTKQAAVRHRILDECFQNTNHLPSGIENIEYGGCWTVDELIEKIEEKSGIVIGDRTIKSDFVAMKIEYGAPIKNERGIGYYYTDKDFSITKNPLSDKDFKVLNEIVDILKNYRGFKYFEEADTLISKIEENMSQTDFSKIQLDILPNYSGIQFISSIKEAIFNRKVISLINQEFDKEEVEVIFHPYVLKEYNNRWFVLGYADKKKNKYGELWLFALDRIKKIKPSDKKFKKPNRKEIKNYFSEIYGVTNYKENETEKVILKLEKFRSNYFKTKPLHKSQKLIKEEVEFDYYSLNLKLNKEIISLFLSFGKDLEVIEPKSFRKEMKEHINRMTEMYS